MEKQTTEITTAQLFAKMCEVQEMLENPKVEKGLWNIQDVADYCGLSYHHVYSTIISDPRFPAPVDLQSRADGNSKRLFVKKEVIAFFERYKKKKHRA
ncbi:helix-turn-helix transcriptional regulator [Ursidibacter sp. B-7004-1]